MKFFGLYVILSILTRNPLLALFILLLVIFFAERRFIGILPDFLGPWRRAGRVRQMKKETELNPANADACLELGEAYFRQGKYRQAVSFLENASGKMAGHPLFHFCLGASYYGLGRIKEGEKEIEKAVEANPKASLGEPYVFLIRIGLEEKQPGEKIEYLFNQLLLYGTPKGFYQAGRLFLQANDRERAKRLFTETVESYEASRGALKRVHRRWAFLSKINLLLIK